MRVVEPADAGRATEAALGAVADALGIPRQSVTLVRGAKSRHKLIGIEVETKDLARVEATLEQLGAGRDR